MCLGTQLEIQWRAAEYLTGIQLGNQLGRLRQRMSKTEQGARRASLVLVRSEQAIEATGAVGADDEEVDVLAGLRGLFQPPLHLPRP